MARNTWFTIEDVANKVGNIWWRHGENITFEQILFRSTSIESGPVKFLCHCIWCVKREIDMWTWFISMKLRDAFRLNITYIGTSQEILIVLSKTVTNSDGNWLFKYWEPRIKWHLSAMYIQIKNLLRKFAEKYVNFGYVITFRRTTSWPGWQDVCKIHIWYL